ncbi:tRNA lysidine(34) synthetase [Aspergillus affinis]|uniref:tRNA lysidine(34) synthetase n=1 Tax=Aspergillus affinis TaxID=1070780 RepID=UPI0022FE0989|nr:PP-loop family protein [Aspergillus affinis]KAI9045204.1 PP-loop family protein [Aspergillus affinis]
MLPARAITTSQFLESFQRAWLESRTPRAERRLETRLPRRIGLAVSGGADSMALAYLCRQWEKTHRSDDVAVTAFVVDHKARAESTREAATVTGWLTELGIRTQVLELSWSQGTLSQPPSQVSAFETHARRLRFQALGTACRDYGIETLLMGHHQDDDVETALWRLCSGARGTGLAGIPSVNPIPECHGLFGVAESGSSVTLRGLPSLSQPGTNKQSESTDDKSLASRRVPMSTGGIFICRPLLSFPKASLLATCHDNHVPYVSDPTNFDPTLTPRNAIRSLLSSDRLPRALQTPSILTLVRKSQGLVRDTTDLSNQFLQKFQILGMNLATGTMTVQFPSSLETLYRKIDPSKIPQLQATTLRRITDLLAPFPGNHFPLRSYEDFTDLVFPTYAVSSTKRQTFTLGGVMFKPVDRPKHVPLDDKSSSTATTNHTDTYTHKPNPNSTTENNNIWFLSRQPFMKNRLPTYHLHLPLPVPSQSQLSSASCGQNPLNTNKDPPQQPTLEEKEEETEEETEETSYTNPTPWILWDNRYWIRVSAVLAENSTINNTPRTRTQPIPSSYYPKKENVTLSLMIRPLLKSDIEFIRQISSSSTKVSTSEKPSVRDIKLDQFLKRLAKEAPGQSRFILPVVVISKECFDGLERDLPVALPTMDQWIYGVEEVMRTRCAMEGVQVQWEWMYKKVDTKPLELMGGLLELEKTPTP